MTSTRPTRQTWQRAAVRDLLADTEEFRTAQQVHEDLRGIGAKVGLATVYRALQAMVESGELDVLRTPDGEAAYRRCSSEHHHHLVCRSCSLTIEISGSEIEEWAARVAAERGFTQAEHQLELSGLCADCGATNSRSAPHRPTAAARSSQTG